MRNREVLVWIPEERVYGWVVGGVGTYFTTIKYAKAGQSFEVLMENEDFELMEEGPIGYDDDE